MNRGGRNSAQGTTIMETLIVLAVTATLFMVASLAINGRQNRTNFQVGSRSIQQAIRDAVNQTESGYYARATGFLCTTGGSPPLGIATGGVARGTNSRCILAGSALVFDPSAANKESYWIYPLAGRRQLSVGGEIRDVKTPAEAWLTAIAKTTGAANPSAPDVASIRLPNGLQYVKGRTVGDASWKTSGRFAVAMVSTFANFTGTGTDNSGGSQALELRRFTGPWTTGVANADSINDEMTQTNPYGTAVSPGAELCFRGSGTDQSVIVQISSGLVVTTSVRDGIACA